MTFRLFSNWQQVHVFPITFSEMTDETSTAQILQEMKAQMDALHEQMVAMQWLQPGTVDAHNSDKKAEEISGTGSTLVTLSDTTRIFLGILGHHVPQRGVNKITIPDCD